MAVKKEKVAVKNRRPLVIVGVFVITLFVLAPTTFAAYYHDRILPRVQVDGVAVGGLMPEEAIARINEAVTQLKEAGIPVTDGTKTVRMESLIDFDVASAVRVAATIGHNGSVLMRIADSIDTLITGQRLALAPSVDRTVLAEKLRESFSPNETKEQNARLVITMNGNRLTTVATVPESTGVTFDYERASQELENELETLHIQLITLARTTTTPPVRIDDVALAAPLVPHALALTPLTLTADDKRWTVTAAELATLLTVTKQDGVPTLDLDTTATTAYLAEFALTYDIPAAQTKLEIDPTTKKVTQFVQGRDGRRINIEKTITQLKEILQTALDDKTTPEKIAVTTEEAKSKVVSETAGALGIEEVIGIGRSNFRGSTAGRIKNIRRGSQKLNGVLIPPGEIFSTVTTLEPITVEDGYVPEQIILGDRITPGVGGGLCQIGTTTFRAAMMAGLPIVERFNHGLVVRYYNDPQNGNPGTDATLYGPSPDLKFLNDTGHWILFTTDLNTKTNDLIYSFWGTSDGRKGYYSPPKVLRWTAPPAEVKNIESTDVAPGETKCQNAFSGADTTFTYTIEQPDGTKKERVFNSHYRALPKICLVNTQTPAPPPLDPLLVLPPETAAGN